QGAVGSAQRVPPRAVRPGGMIVPADAADIARAHHWSGRSGKTLIFSVFMPDGGLGDRGDQAVPTRPQIRLDSHGFLLLFILLLWVLSHTRGCPPLGAEAVYTDFLTPRIWHGRRRAVPDRHIVQPGDCISSIAFE